ncbi:MULTISPECIES: hypothetical protein [unclassified Gilliamella]|uniref:hypothetical protein n=1 Tax=unclassified Gilliamella TaxID=2685620 RepID=UPI00132A386D|nr:MULTISPECIES: hypothetical protein [unclassified Gilliamella]MWN32641.1 hypothetical protein [Gilliamella sp. Pra-s60]MWP30090.1 hypothetical protein [Gilliamella sp. Pra-s54]
MKKAIVLFLIIFCSIIADASAVPYIRSYRGSDPHIIHLIDITYFLGVSFILLSVANDKLKENKKSKRKKKLNQNKTDLDKKAKSTDEKNKK